MSRIDGDPAAVHDRLVAEGVIDAAPSEALARLQRVATPDVAVPPGHSHPRPEDIFDALVAAGSLIEPPESPPDSTVGGVHPADLVEWAIHFWWPGYVARWPVEIVDPGDLEAGVAELAQHLSLGDPTTTPAAAAGRVRTYVYEAAFALLAGEPLPVPGDEPENRLQILRGITNQAAEAAYGALVTTLMPEPVGEIPWVLPEGVLPEAPEPTTPAPA